MSKKYIYVIVTYVVMQFSSLLALPFLPFIEDRHAFSVGWSVSTFALALLVCIYLLRDEVKDFFQMRNKKIGSIVLWSVLGFIMVMVAQYVAVFIEMLVLRIPPGSENTMNLMGIARQSPIFIIIIALIGPILEELVFRKAIFGTLYKKMNFFFAALLSGVIFAAVHMDFDHLLIYTAVGMVLAFLYVETKRIIVPIIAHMSMNSVAVIAQLSIDPEQIEEQMKQINDLMFILIGG
ncbi:CPBP family intramembrane glutamic endopeptidase [Gracilibacillus alcaliphilus]|uniref:CPBP family intramembrane glutamic endopeptidase n=1 Tax=Gracilibacillus alcaliphilus TaxID=1401441 RepID=UPI0019595082|nr:type II CAAX endopeptidase family protein [Gracilibacillus alcaliphilus]MBM7679636.1 membrane protease YdiL (CAAX protease family) [Gracilibacillus alcaliphilus]